MKNADIPAMAVYETNGDGILELSSVGLTKREYFAGLAMQAMLSSKHVSDFSNEINDPNRSMPSGLAGNAVRYADALLEELAK